MVAGAAAAVAGGCTSTSPKSVGTSATAPASPNAASAVARAIQPMTKVAENPRQGYFPDPYPIHLAASDAHSLPLSFAGTRQDIISCPGSISAGCFHQQAITLAIGSKLAARLHAHGASLTTSFNHNIYQQNSGAWQMAVTYDVKNPKYPKATSWTVIVHAHPATVPAHGIPTSWVADSLLVGSFTRPTLADYDGKFVENDGALYLIYSKRLSTSPARDGLVAQLMTAPTAPAATPPTVLLAPGDYNSEYYFGLHQSKTFKLIETGNLTEIDGKYVLAYSTGSYKLPDYKIGIAWSDTFLPRAGTQYRKVTMTDTQGVWGKAGSQEVRYLLQSQLKDWPNYVGGTVLAPGVPSLVQEGDGWYLFFAGYLPSNASTKPGSDDYQASNRRPYFVPLSVDIPAGADAATASSANLATWITVDTRG